MNAAMRSTLEALRRQLRATLRAIDPTGDRRLDGGTPHGMLTRHLSGAVKAIDKVIGREPASGSGA